MTLAATRARTQAWRDRPLPDGLAGEIRRLREAKDWTQEQLATRACLSFAAIQFLESGRTKHPRVDTLQRLARALDVDVGALTEEA